jgi:hypothetical protein
MGTSSLLASMLLWIQAELISALRKLITDDQLSIGTREARVPIAQSSPVSFETQSGRASQGH